MNAPGIPRPLALGLCLASLAASAHGQGTAPATNAAPAKAAFPAPAGLQVVPLADTQLEQAGALFAQGKFAEALAAYGEALPAVRDARREEILYRVAECYRLLGRDDDALGAYRLLVETFPQSLFRPGAQYRAGEVLYRKGSYAEALVLFTAALDHADAKTAEAARYYIAACQLQTGQEKAALPVLQALADLKPPTAYTPAAAQLLAEFAEKKSNWATALKDWSLVLDLTTAGPGKAQAAGRAAMAAVQLDKQPDAEKLFLAARAADPDGPYAKLANTGLLDLWFRQARYKEVVDFYDKNRDRFLDASRAEVFLHVARSYYRMKDPVDAVSAFDLFLGQFKDHPLAPTAAYERLAARSEIDPANVLDDTAAFLAAYPQSSYRPAVLFLRARQYSAQKAFAEAKPIWDELVRPPLDPALPAADLFYEDARVHYELKEWKAAADAFGLFLDKFPKHPAVLSARQCQAAALQNIPDAPNAVLAWNEVLKMVPAKSADAQTALEQLAILDNQLQRRPDLLAVFRQIVDGYPQSRLLPLAAYTLGAEAFTAKNYDAAEPLLRRAREADAKAWQVPATYRLLCIAYARKNAEATSALVREYDAFPDTQATAVRVPAAIYYWLGVQAAAGGHYQVAAEWFTRVTTHPDPDTYLVSAWWELGEAQRHLAQWADAVKSYEQFRTRDAKTADSSPVLLALAEAQIGAGQFGPAKDHLDAVLLQEPEGRNNARARYLVGQWHLAQKQYGDALKSFTTLSLIYRDDDLTPRAMARAAQAAELSGDAPQAEALRKKLKEQFPGFADPGA